jgi:hypothetical protein
MIKSLERVAAIASGRWKRALRTGDRSADMAVEEMADGIAAAARRWKIAVARGGGELEDVRLAFVDALVKATSDRWSELPANVTAKQLIRRKLAKIARRCAAAGVFVSGVICVTSKPLGWDPSSTVGTITVLAGAVVAVGIDPSLPEVISNASKLTQLVPSKK